MTCHQRHDGCSAGWEIWMRVCSNAASSAGIESSYTAAIHRELIQQQLLRDTIDPTYTGKIQMQCELKDTFITELVTGWVPSSHWNWPLPPASTWLTNQASQAPAALHHTAVWLTGFVSHSLSHCSSQSRHLKLQWLKQNLVVRRLWPQLSSTSQNH